MPGCPVSAPCSRHCKPMTVLPLPGPPLRRVTRPAGKPPPSTKSNPLMPVDTFGSFFLLFRGPSASLAFVLRFAVAIAARPLLPANHELSGQAPAEHHRHASSRNAILGKNENII